MYVQYYHYIMNLFSAYYQVVFIVRVSTYLPLRHLSKFSRDRQNMYCVIKSLSQHSHKCNPGRANSSLRPCKCSNLPANEGPSGPSPGLSALDHGQSLPNPLPEPGTSMKWVAWGEHL